MLDSKPREQYKLLMDRAMLCKGGVHQISATGVCLHEIFNHNGEEKLYRTLGSTVGYKQVRLKLPPCKWCAAAKARQFGLEQKPVIVACVICDVDSLMEI